MAQAQGLAGRVAVVTGAANGMARVMARTLAGAGARVAGVDVDAGDLNRLAAEPVFAGKFLKPSPMCPRPQIAGMPLSRCSGLSAHSIS